MLNNYHHVIEQSPSINIDCSSLIVEHFLVSTNIQSCLSNLLNPYVNVSWVGVVPCNSTAIEDGPCIHDVPLKNGDFPWLLNNQSVIVMVFVCICHDGCWSMLVFQQWCVKLGQNHWRRQKMIWMLYDALWTVTWVVNILLIMVNIWLLYG